MIINFWLLPIALVLLWFPRSWLRFGGQKTGGSRRRSKAAKTATGLPLERQQDDQSLWLREEFAKRRNWLDLLRAIAGSIAIWMVAIEASPDATSETVRAVLVLKIAILVIAVMTQAMRFEGKLTLFPPVFFVTGLAFGVLGIKPACFALITIWAVNLVLPSPAVFLTVYAAFVMTYGMLLAGEPTPAIVAAALAVLPVCFSLVLRRRLLQLSKKPRVALR